MWGCKDDLRYWDTRAATVVKMREVLNDIIMVGLYCGLIAET